MAQSEEFNPMSMAPLRVWFRLLAKVGGVTASLPSQTQAGTHHQSDHGRSALAGMGFIRSAGRADPNHQAPHYHPRLSALGHDFPP